MIHSNGAFPSIKGNPTTNYCITPEDEVRERIHLMNARDKGESWPPHDGYIGERVAVTNSSGSMQNLAKVYLNSIYGIMSASVGRKMKGK